LVEVEMASPELHKAPLQVVCIADALDVSLDPAENRRAHERLRASDLRWLRGARIKYGADIRVLDISAGGMLLETSSQLAPDANVVVELIGPESPILVPSRVVRCRTASLGEILKYQGACVFKRPLSIPELTRRAGPAQDAPAARPAAPTATLGWQKVIARFNDGRMVAGYTNDFHPSKPQLHLFPNPRQGESTFIPIAKLKALFFVREFAGDPTLVERKDFVDAPQGRKVEVTFHDDEVMVGSTLGYRGEGNGFFLHPADGRSNNLRVFVTASGLRQMRFL
jgi:hypothetical protein